MPAHNLLSRVPRHFVKTITFTGLTGAGLVDEKVQVGTVTGRVLIVYGSAYCSTLLTENGATATISLGTINNVAGLIAVTDSVDIDATEFWRDATPELEVSTAITNQLVASDIEIDCLVDDTASGVIQFVFLWLPISVDGLIA